MEAVEPEQLDTEFDDSQLFIHIICKLINKSIPNKQWLFSKVYVFTFYVQSRLDNKSYYIYNNNIVVFVLLKTFAC